MIAYFSTYIYKNKKITSKSPSVHLELVEFPRMEDSSRDICDPSILGVGAAVTISLLVSEVQVLQSRLNSNLSSLQNKKFTFNKIK